jgi:hypothetical protein
MPPRARTHGGETKTNVNENFSEYLSGVNSAVVHQFEMTLPAPPTDENLEDKLRQLTVEFNEAVEPLERAELMQEIRRLRALLGKRNGGAE